MAELNIIEKVIALEAVDLLKNLERRAVSRIASIAKEVRMPGKSCDWTGNDTRRAIRHT